MTTPGQMQRGQVARVYSATGGRVTVTIRRAFGQHRCANCFADIEHGALHGSSSGEHYCLTCCEPIPPAATQEEMTR